MTALQPDPLHNFDWVDAESAWSKALSLLVKKGTVEVDRSQRTAVYRLVRAQSKTGSR